MHINEIKSLSKWFNAFIVITGRCFLRLGATPVAEIQCRVFQRPPESDSSAA